MKGRELIRDWLSFSRKERTGIIVLLCIINLVWILPVFFSTEEVPDEILQITPVRYETAKAIIVVKMNNQKKDWAYTPGKVYSSNNNKPVQQPKKLDVNQADSTSLEALPGIGEKLSSRIVRYRDRLGGFITVDQLKEVYGLSDSTFLLVRKFLYVADGYIPSQIAVNQATYADFRRHPYISAAFLKALLAYRKSHLKVDDYRTCEHIANQIGDTLNKQIKAYLNFNQ
jgi:competence ComEA-like helix-hairpin-helix protein